MIEVVYKENKERPVGNEGFFDIPKNIRQIGQVEDDFKIYIEDYAYHYLDRMADDVAGGRTALLLGAANWSAGTTYIFIRSAFAMEIQEVDTNHITFHEEVWTKASAVMEKYFEGQQIVGWFFTMPECSMEITEAMYRTHLNYFAGNDKVFFLKEPLEGEECFYRYDNGKMARQRGYYLYYQRNDSMQEFMIDQNQNMPLESGEMVRDKAVKDFREIISGKNEDEDKDKKKGFPFVYASTAAAIIVALALGTSYLNDYRRLKEVPQAVEEVASQLQETPEPTTILKVTAPPQETEAAEDEENVQTVEDGDDPSKQEMVKSETAGQETAGQESAGQESAGQETAGQESAGQESAAEQETAESETAESESTPAPAKQQVIAQDTRTYQVQQGDTLTSISYSIYGSTGMVHAICQANGIDESTTIYPGETILLP